MSTSSSTPSSSSSTSPVCPRCGAHLASDAPRGLCPACLLGAHFGPDATPTEAGLGESSAPPLSPQEIAPLFPELEIISCLGRGGMGVVYKARQPKLDRLVALKILPPDISHDSAFSTRFTHEAKALARLNHPGIVTLYEFGQVAGGQYFFLMEFVDGVNLRQLQQAGRVSAREALAIVPQICDALQYAHDEGIIHRDIKPENLLIDRRGRVKIADFGLAKLVGAAGNLATDSAPSNPPPGPGQTDAGRVMGTPSYMAPEQRSHPTAVDHRADIYALGVVFYQLLTGELPGRQLEPPSRKVHIDVRLDEIVLRAMEKEPHLRFQQASEVKTQLETFAANASSAPAKPPSTPPRRRHGWKIAASFAAAACLAAITFFWTKQRFEKFSFAVNIEATPRSVPVESPPPAPVVPAPAVAAPKTILPRETATALVLDLSPYFRSAYAPLAGPNERFRPLYGRQTVDGVPMQIDGEVILFSQGLRTTSKSTKPVEASLIQGIAVGRAFDELHLIHHTRGTDIEGQPVAAFTLRYDDGTSASLPVHYGVHLREWLHGAAEEKELLTDPNSKVFWRGAGVESINATGRLFKSTLLNPHPEKKVLTIDLSSPETNLAAYTLLAATVASRDPGRPVSPPVPTNQPERKFDGQITIRIVDEKTEQPLSDVLVTLTVHAESYYTGPSPVLTPAEGEAVLRFPTTIATHLGVTASKPGWITVSENSELPANRLTLRLKRSKEPPSLAQPAAPFKAPAPEPARAQATMLALDLTPFHRIVFAKQSGPGERFKSAHGRQLIDGVPLYLDGEAILFGQTQAEQFGAKEGLYPDAITGLRVDRAFDELHLVHHTRWPDIEGRTIATITLHYDDDTTTALPIIYGTHLREWLRNLSEEKETLTDPHSKIFWRGAGVKELHAKGRLFKTTLSNPHPGKKVLTLDLSSARNLAAYSLLAATVTQRDPSRSLTPPLPDALRSFDGQVAITVVDSITGLPVPGALVEPIVTLGNVSAVGAPSLTDADGKTVLHFPTKETESIALTARKDGWHRADTTCTPGEPTLVIRLNKIPSPVAPPLTLWQKISDFFRG